MKTEINRNTLELITGDITEQETDAIVNAANGSLLGGGGVDGAIHRAAGKELLEACKEVRQEQLAGEKLSTGEAVITNGYNLPANYVIHTVGPVWNERDQHQEDLLVNCYRNSLELAMTHNATSIAFPSISTGVYRFSVELAANIALQTITDFLTDHDLGNVVMVLFSENDYATYETSLRKIQR
ncbi:O-acetyl-ADP-ribose deacetylase [Lentibacillus salinarum]|uniref:O-acetyl-ADP-ribose deacetylase n=1 Tax=Lentibacillus salinarum TaxID=446820 RepID=A0ABW3ZWN8_9BACI